MFLPHPVLDQMSPRQVETWNTHFAGGHDRPRSVEEGIWRRTQDPANAAQSGWRQDADGRRRIVHYWYQYGIDYTHPIPRLVLEDLYLYVSATAPADEIAEYAESLAQARGAGVGGTPRSGGATGT